MNTNKTDIDRISEILYYKISGEKNIIEMLEYNGISYWWFIDFAFHTVFQSRLPLHPTTLGKIYLNISKFLPHSKYIIDSGLNCLKKLQSTHNPNVYLLSPPLKYDLLYYMLDWEWRKENGNQLVNIYHSEILRNLPLELSKISMYDINVNYCKSRNAWNNLLSTEKQPCLPVSYSDLFWTLNSSKENINARKYFKAVWKTIEPNNKWFKLWADFYNVSIPEVKNVLKELITERVCDEVSRVINTENALKTIKPTICVMRNEQMNSGRGFVYAARNLNTFIIGIQHATINNHPAYIFHNPADVSSSKNKSGLSFPVPDVTCVWGEYEYNLLVNTAGYPAAQVIVTGNPRYDYLGKATETYSKTEFCSKYNINSENPIILWSTQCHGFNDEENETNFTEVFDTFKELSDITLIIKQHPNEDDRYRNLINNYIDKYNLKINLLVPDRMENTTEMVYISDILINKHSTTGQEAVAFHKPMIIMDFGEIKDLSGYVKEGVGIPVYEKGILKKTIEDILANKYDLKEAQDKYIRNHMYKIDGQASKRVADVIMQYINKEKPNM